MPPAGREQGEGDGHGEPWPALPERVDAFVDETYTPGHDVLNSMTVVRARAECLDAHLEDGQRESVEAILNQAESVIDLSQRARAMVTAVAAALDFSSSGR